MTLIWLLFVGLSRAFYWEEKKYEDVTLNLFNGKFKGREVEFSDGKKIQIFRGHFLPDFYSSLILIKYILNNNIPKNRDPVWNSREIWGLSGT